MLYLVVVVLVVGLAAVAVQLMRKRDVPWRIAMAIPSIGVAVGGLLYLVFNQSPTWLDALLWLVVAAIFYVNMLVLWWFFGSSLRQHGFRW